MTNEEYLYLIKKIKELTRFDLGSYGSNQMSRRLEGFIARSKINGVAQYCKLLEKDAREVEKLQDFLTINVSEFFRDMTPFKYLKEKILPPLLQGNLKLNIWSAGCSNGSEVYSVTIILDQLSPYRSHRMLATDIDKGILEQAAAGGPYKDSDIRNVPQDTVKKYFTRKEDAYWVNEKIRSKVTYRLHDLTRDPFEINFDLIICRNVVIYFNEEAKRKLRQRFYDALKPNGILFIGATETILDADDAGFRRLSPCFFQKTGKVLEKSRAESVSAK
jgi:chemotaxis protein methyltransferase CheR